MTTEKPSEPGYYWAFVAGEKPSVVLIERGVTETMLVIGDERSQSIRDVDAWEGPLTPSCLGKT